MINGTPIKGKKGWVHFGKGQISEFEYKKWLAEHKAVEDEKERKIEQKKVLKKIKEQDKITRIEKQKKKTKATTKDIKLKEEESSIHYAEEYCRSVGIKIPENVVGVVAQIEKLNKLVLERRSLAEAAIALEISKSGLSGFITKYLRVKSYNAYARNLRARHQEVTMPWGIKKTKIKRDVRFYIRVPFESFKARLEGHADPIVSTGDKDPLSRWYSKAEPGQRFGKNVLIVPDRTLQPIKRTRIAAHSFLTAGEWNNGNSLKDASCKLATKKEDKYLTVEGGIIVSTKFAKREHLQVGDKILGVNGLKCIVSLIRKQAHDLVINKNQIWGEKMSRLCGCAVLSMQEDKISIFYQPEHKVQTEIKKGTEPHVRFSPDLVPFLAYYLSSTEIGILQGKNRERFQDIMYMLNIDFVNKDGYLMLIPKKTQPTEREGGMLYPFNQVYWGKKDWVEGLGKKKVDMGTAGLQFPFVLENIWIPTWLKKEHEHRVEKNGEIKIRNLEIIDKIKEQPEKIWLGGRIGALIYHYIFAKIDESLSYLTAFAKLGAPNEVFLNKKDCEVIGVKDKDTVLIFRYPVVGKLNIQKMRVCITSTPRSTIGINVESIRLMHGDFDGDPLYLLKIPQTPDFAKGFSVSSKIYNEERKAVLEEIAENDAVKLPKNEREVKIAQRIAFYQSKIDAGDWLPNKLVRFRKKSKDMPTGYLRTDEELIEEAREVHDEMNASGTRAATIGTATKWMWLGSENATEKDIDCIASLEIIKDRLDKDSVVKYKRSLKILAKYKKNLETVKLASGKKVLSWQVRAFQKLISAGTFRKGASKNGFPKLSNLKNAPIIKAKTPYAKFILALCRRV